MSKPDSPALLDNGRGALASGDTNQALARCRWSVRRRRLRRSYIKLARAWAQSGASAAAIGQPCEGDQPESGLIDCVWQAELLRKQNKHRGARSGDPVCSRSYPSPLQEHLLAGDLLMQAGKPAGCGGRLHPRPLHSIPAEPLAALRLSDACLLRAKDDAEAVVAKWLKVHPPG